MAADDICVVDFDLRPIEGQFVPSKEAAMHIGIYKHRSDVNAIVHTHQTYASILAVIEESIPPLFDEETKEKLKALVLFGTQAALIKENAHIQENLRQVNRNYSDLLSVITHEFKNSLTSIYGYNRIISKRITEGRTEKLHEITNQVDRLSKKLFGLVETLFNMSLIEQNKHYLNNYRKLFYPNRIHISSRILSKSCCLPCFRIHYKNINKTILKSVCFMNRTK